MSFLRSGSDAGRRSPAPTARQPEPQPIRSTLIVALSFGIALFGVVQLAGRMAPSDAELAAIVLANADTVDARRALYALVAREVQRNREVAELDEVVPRLGPAERAFLADFRPDLLRRGRGEPR